MLNLSVLLLALSLLFPNPAAAREVLAQARVPVDVFQNGLLESMRGGANTGFGERRDSLVTLITNTFDIAYIERVILGQHGKTMTREERGTLGPLMLQLAASLLAKQFGTYNNERFEIKFARPLSAGRVRVRSAFVSGDGEITHTDYIVRPDNDKGDVWHIRDFQYDGISGTRIHRAEYASILKNGGVKELIAKLREKIAQMEAQGS
ncbi:MAG: hypothetical protein GKR94_07845 [Gammaproteobacteria bacterium]|nr:hypothetical protein [Gammaproteobacteria bacterium]